MIPKCFHEQRHTFGGELKTIVSIGCDTEEEIN